MSLTEIQFVLTIIIAIGVWVPAYYIIKDRRKS